MSNHEDTDSAPSASTMMDKAIVTKDELPHVTYQHLQTLTQGYVSNALTEWAMVTPERKYEFIQATKAVMIHNNLWTYEENTLLEELKRHSSTSHGCGDPEDLFTLNDADPRYGINVHLMYMIQKYSLDDLTLNIVEHHIVFGNCPSCFKMMPVGFACPNCGMSVACTLYCVADHLEVIFREKDNEDRRKAVVESPKDFAKADALLLSKMVNRTPHVELDFNMYIGPSANYWWNLDTKHFFSIEQLINEMSHRDTLKGCVPDLHSKVKHATNVSYRVLRDSLRPLVNNTNLFATEEQQTLASQMIETNEMAITEAECEEDGFVEQLQRQVAANPRKYSDEDQS